MKWLRTVPALVIAAFLLMAYSFGPPDGHTGAPNEDTCGNAACHGNLNTGPGALSLAGAESFIPGDTLRLTVNLQQQGQRRWGFELTVLDANHQPAGQLLVVDSRNTQKSRAPAGREYLKHTETGTYFNTPNASPGWQFAWVAPASGVDQVIFYLAGNAANANFDNSGDFIYTATKSLPANPTGVTSNDEELPGAYALHQNYPNPFNPGTTIAYHLATAGLVKLTVHDVNGRMVADLIEEWQSAGAYKLTWEAHNLPAGIYFARIITGDFSATRRMILLK